MDTPFDTLMESVDTPLVVVTTAAEGTLAGCVVGFHAQSSIDAEGYSFWLSKANHTYRTSLRSAHFAVHFLTTEDLDLAERFGTQTGEETDKFSGLDVELDEHGVPVIRACPNRMLVDRVAVLDDGGDHVCVTTRVRSAASSGPFTPLRLSDAAHFEPGHDAEERAVSP
ncbi:flavin reductase family protein [Nocardioides daphniae]|uniref:flavin reductase family protein n=1 Tax=Nocardioides daphniae TaxID=402297 RepID=UPI0019310461|nr:flavin reductase [Nocardioides daphniae]